MAAKRRVTPSVESLGTPQTAPAVGSPNYNVIGAAGPPIGPNPLAQLSQSLRRFNPVLGQYAAAKQQMSAEDAKKWFDEMEQGVSDNAIFIKRKLKELGYDDHANPEIYKQEIINTAQNFAVRDATAIATNPEFLTAMQELSKTSDDFANDAVALINEKFPHPEREAEDKKVGHYWEVGYGKGWITARDHILSPFVEAHEKARPVQIKQAFFENGRNQLASALSSSSKDWEPKFLGLRKFLNTSYGGYAGQGAAYSQAVMDNIIKPVFMDLARDPNNDINLAAAWNRVTKLTRDNPNGGRTQLFKKHSDISMAAGVNTATDVWAEIAQAEEQAYYKQSKKQNTLQTDLNNKVQQTLGNWETFSQTPENIEWAKGENIFGLDPFDRLNHSRIADALSRHPDLRLPPTVANDQVMYMFSDAVRDGRTAVLKIDTEGIGAEKDYRDALMNSLSVVAQESGVPILQSMIPKIEKAIGNPSLSIPDIRKEALAFLNTDEFKMAFFTDNPNIDPETLPWKAAITQAFDKMSEGTAISTGRDYLHLANALLDNPNTATKDLNGIYEDLRDILNEVDDTDLESDIKGVMDTIKQRNDLKPYYTITDKYLNDIVNEAITDTVNEELANVYALANQRLPTGEGAGTINVADPVKIMAADGALAKAVTVARNEWNEQVSAGLAGIDPVERDAAWSAKGLKDTVRERTVNSLKRTFKHSVLNDYNEALRRDPKAAIKQEEQEQGIFTDDIKELIKNKDGVEKQFHTDKIYGGSATEGKETEVKPNLSLQFMAGPKGQQRYNNLKENKRKIVKARKELIGNIYNKTEELKKLEETGSQSAQRSKAAERDNEVLTFKAFEKEFGILPWEKLNSPEGLTLELPTAGAPIQVKFDLDEDRINLNNTLVFESLPKISEKIESLNTWEEEQGGKDAETNRESAPEDLKEHANFIKRAHGIDILARDPSVRKSALEDYTQLLQSQAGMIHSSHPEQLPVGVRKDLEDQALKQFYTSDSNKFQGITFSENEKSWVAGVHQQREDIIAGKYNVEDGLTSEEFIKNYKALTGGEISREVYTVYDGTLHGVPQRQISLTRKTTSLNPKSEAEVIAQELAMLDIGIPNPILSTRVKKNSYGWAGVGEDSLLFSILGDDFFGADPKEMQLKPEGLKRLRERTNYYRGLLEAPSVKQTDLAKAFNKLLKGETNYFENRYNRENTFGITPLPIPRKQK